MSWSVVADERAAPASSEPVNLLMPGHTEGPPSPTCHPDESEPENPRCKWDPNITELTRGPMETVPAAGNVA
jgi:hypothetical protein